MRYTLWGLYQYDPKLFDNLVLPVQMDKDIMIDTLMQKCGMLYPYHQQPDYFKLNVRNWFKRRQFAFSRMFQALEEDYSPIENYDRYEEWTDTPDVTYTSTGGHTSKLDKDGGHTNVNTKTGGYTDTDIHSGGTTDRFTKSGNVNEDELLSGGSTTTRNGTNTDSQENKVSAYNDSTYSPNTQNTGNSTVKETDTMVYNDENHNKVTTFNDYVEERTIQHDTDTISKTVTYNNTRTTDDFNYIDESETETFTYQNEQRKESGTRGHEGHIHGNIGVTTAQKMITEELELRQYDLYNVICELFEKEFLSQVY